MIRRLAIIQNLFSAIGHLLNDAQRVAVIDLLMSNCCSWPLPGREKHLKRADLARYLDESAELLQNCEPEIFFELRSLMGAAMKFLRVEADCDRLTSTERMYALRALRNLVFARPCGVHLFSNIKDPRLTADWLEDSAKAFGTAPGATICAELTETWDAVQFWKNRPIEDAAERMAAIKLARNGEPAVSSPHQREDRRLAAVA